MHAACGPVWSYSSKIFKSLSVCYVQVWLTMGCLAISLLTQLFSSSSGVRGHAIFARLCKDPYHLYAATFCRGCGARSQSTGACMTRKQSRIIQQRRNMQTRMMRGPKLPGGLPWSFVWRLCSSWGES